MGLWSKGEDWRRGDRTLCATDGEGASCNTPSCIQVAASLLSESYDIAMNGRVKRRRVRIAGSAVGIVTRMCRDAGPRPVTRWRSFAP